jgi:hypothetical protein
MIAAEAGIGINMPPLSMITTYFVPLALIDYFILAAHLWQQLENVKG